MHKGLKLVEGKAATKAEEGNIEYWYCEDCDRYYVEDNGYVEIQKADTVIAKIADNNNSNGTGSGDAEEKETPDTADNNSIFVWLLMLSVGGMTVGMAISSKKRRTNR